MPSIRFRLFGGIIPAVDPKSLKDLNATVAHNTRLRDGTLRPFQAPLLVTPIDHVEHAQTSTTPGKKFGLYCMPDTQCCCGGPVTFDCSVSVVQLPTPGDCSDFCHSIVFPCDCDCKHDPYYYNACTKETCPVPVRAPSRKAQALPLVKGTDLKLHPYAGPDERSYTYTWVDKFNVESPPGPPTDPLCSYDDDTWRITKFDTPPANAVCIRIYRSVSYYEEGDQPDTNMMASYQLVDEVRLNQGTAGVPVAPAEYIDDKCLREMDHGTLQTEMDCPPPCMDQVVTTESGFLVGFRGNQLYVSERYEAHNWPEKYRMELPDKIVGLAVMYDFVFIGTTGRPYRMNVAHTAHNGISEATLDPVPYTEDYPCLTRHSMVATAFGALYVSRKGLIALAPTGTARLLSRNMIDEDDWIEWVPNIAAYHNGKYFASRTPAGKTWILDVPDPVEGNIDLGALVTIDMEPDAIHTGRDGHLYFLKNGQLYIWNESTDNLIYRWKSRVVTTGGHMQYAAIKLVGDFGTPVKVKIYADGRLFDELTVKHQRPYRLKRNGRGIRWQIEVEGTTQICEIHMATSIAELTEG